MSERCSECQRRPARRRGLCVYCVRAADDERYATRLTATKRRVTARRRQTAREREQARFQHLAALRDEWQREPRAKRLLEWAFLYQSIWPTPAEDIERRTALDKAIEQQDREHRRSHYGTSGEYTPESRSIRPWLSLDQIVGPSEDGEDMTLGGALVPACDPFDPQTYLESQLLDTIVGDLSVGDVTRLHASTFAHLQQALVEAGFGSRPVQQKERKRMRVNESHRGNGASMTFQGMLSKGKKRRDSKVRGRSGRGRRPDRKPRRRWNRETVVFDWKAAA